MTFAEFRQSLEKSKPPANLTPALAGLWWAAKDDWDRAHKLVMDEDGKDSAWVHAYLHRAEGDNENARYWYQKAGKTPANGPLQPEWDAITAELLSI